MIAAVLLALFHSCRLGILLRITGISCIHNSLPADREGRNRSATPWSFRMQGSSSYGDRLANTVNMSLSASDLLLWPVLAHFSAAVDAAVHLYLRAGRPVGARGINKLAPAASALHRQKFSPSAIKIRPC
jgi:hypothetical protein